MNTKNVYLKRTNSHKSSRIWPRGAQKNFVRFWQIQRVVVRRDRGIVTDSVSVTEMVKSLNILQFAYRKHQANKFVRIMFFMSAWDDITSLKDK